VTVGGGPGCAVGDVQTDALVDASGSGSESGNGNDQSERNNEAGAKVTYSVLRGRNPSVLHYPDRQRERRLWWNDTPEYRLGVHYLLLHIQPSLGGLGQDRVQHCSERKWASNCRKRRDTVG
jgi:hypothetical protein